MSGLFSTFNIARRGMEVQQKAIDVTAHNISNTNTDGYSRQRAIIETSKPFGMPSLNSVMGPGQLGTGSQIASIDRVRDSFMDFQVRGQNSTLGEFQARDKFLSEIEGIFKEPSDTGMSKLITNFFNSWQDLSGDANNSNTRTVVAQNASALANNLNHSYTRLQAIKDNVQTVIKDDVFEVNSIFRQLDQVNQQIKGVVISGNRPNDLMDKRDIMIDTLSTKFGVKVDKKMFDAIELSPEKSASDPSGNVNLVQSEDHEDVRTFSYVDSITKTATVGKYDIVYYKKGDKANDSNKVTISNVTLNDNQLKELDECRVIWADKDGNAIDKAGKKIAINTDSAGNQTSNIDLATENKIMLFKPESGELQGYMSVQRDVDDYVDQLNRLAKSIAFSVNTIHSASSDSDTDKMPFFLNTDEAKKYGSYNINHTFDTPNSLTNILGAEKDITAGNIAVSDVIIYDVMNIKVKKDDKVVSDSGATDGSRAMAIAMLRDKLLNIQGIGTSTTRKEFLPSSTATGVTDPFESTDNLGLKSQPGGMKIDSYFKDTVDRLGIQEQEALRKVKNQKTVLADFQQRRDSISGVSLDEEIANLIQFQHAYQANAKIVSTVDQLLDVVINGLKR